jgi:prepilin-type N-terminal cleavage/methylation domain-containing protein
MRTHPNKGFTLLEVLVSIAIFAIIGASVASTMGQMTKLTKKIKLKEVTVMTGQIALDRIQRDLQMAFHEKVQKSPCFFKASNVGAGPELTFSFIDSELKTLFQSRTPGVVLAHYFTERDDNGTVKILRASGPLYLGENIRNESGSVIATGVLEWTIEYYDVQNDLWHANWDTAAPQTLNAFPRAVRLTLKTVDPLMPKELWKERALTLSTEFLVLNESEIRK